MRQIILALVILVSLNCFGQITTEFKINNNLTINLPANFEFVDTLGQKIIKAKVDSGLIIISKGAIEDKTSIYIRDEKELVEFYNGIQEGVLNSSKGELISKEIVEINKLKLKRFSYRAKMGDDIQIRDYLGLLLNDTIYSFNYWQFGDKADAMKGKRDNFFASLKINPTITFKSQLINSNDKSITYGIGYFLGKYLGYILVIGALALLIVWLVKRQNKKNE